MALCVNTLSIGGIVVQSSAQLYYIDMMRNFTNFTKDSDCLRIAS